jgi:acetyl esterase
MLDPQARALLDQMAEAGIPPVYTLTPAEARASYRDRRFFTQPEPPAVGRVRDLTGAGLPMRLVRPLGVADDAKLPLLLYLHGGGWTIGDLDTHDVLCRTLAAQAGIAVLSVDYRMGPEHRFPAAVDDSLAALHFAQQEAASLGIDAARIAVGGDSAGGNLAAVACLAQRDAGGAMPVFQLLIYPGTDMRGGTPSHSANGQGYLLTVDSMAYYRGHYMDDDLRPDAPPNPQWSDWRASPLLAASHAGLPPALVLTAGYDPLRDEGRLYADALSAAGTPAQYVCFERQIHGFITMGRVIDEANTAVDLCASALRRAFAPGGAGA